MTQREKVIKGLICIAGDVVFCKHCKYSNVNGFGRGDRCKRDCAKDAIALLTVQEPRVMTLEEVKTLEENTPLYIEQWDGLHGWDVYSGVESGTDDIMTGAPWAVAEYWSQDEYGDTWRCWTSRPTDEQRETVKWE